MFVYRYSALYAVYAINNHTLLYTSAHFSERIKQIYNHQMVYLCIHIYCVYYIILHVGSEFTCAVYKRFFAVLYESYLEKSHEIVNAYYVTFTAIDRSHRFTKFQIITLLGPKHFKSSWLIYLTGDQRISITLHYTISASIHVPFCVHLQHYFSLRI